MRGFAGVCLGVLTRLPEAQGTRSRGGGLQGYALGCGLDSPRHKAHAPGERRFIAVSYVSVMPSLKLRAVMTARTVQVRGEEGVLA